MSHDTIETVPDSIERSIDIAAPAERVWELVAEPGWFINAGTLRPHTIERLDDGSVVVHDDEVGRFRVRIEALEPPSYARFAWEAGEKLDGEAYDTPMTTVEFFVAEHPDGVTLRVVESGFASWGDDAVKRRKAFDDNTEGWELELALAKRELEAGRTPWRATP